MIKIKYLKKAKYLIGLTNEEKNYLLPTMALYCLEKGSITLEEISILVKQTKEEIEKRS